MTPFWKEKDKTVGMPVENGINKRKEKDELSIVRRDDVWLWMYAMKISQ